ncbi:MAG: alpha/beta fold hydrolase [Gammaproteobacteria bacterium]
MRSRIIETIAVAGGDCTVARWPGEGMPLLAVHGITASHCAWPGVVDAMVSRCAVLAPDLRGRGASAGLPPPYGLKVHVADLLAVLDYHGVADCVVAGHSLGAYIALELAAAAPARVRGLVLVDGGLALPLREGSTPEQVIQGVLESVLKRLEQHYADRAAAHRAWREHPAFQDAGAWNAIVEDYVDYDLAAATGGGLRSRTNPEAVRVDSYGPVDPAMPTLIDSIRVPMLLLTAPRGILNQPKPLLPASLVDAKCARLPNLRHVEIPDTNHYSIILGSGAPAVAREIDRFLYDLS